MTLAELIEKRYELLKEKARYLSVIRQAKVDAAHIEMMYKVNTPYWEIKPEARRSALMDMDLAQMPDYVGPSSDIVSHQIEIDHLEPEIAYIEDLIELAKLEMSHDL